MIKLLIASLAQFTTSKEYASAVETRVSDFIKKTVRAEALRIGFTLLLGLICTSMIIYALIQLAKILQTYLSQFDYGTQVEVGLFSVLAVGSAVGLYFLFKKDKPKVTEAAEDIGDTLSVVLHSAQNIALKFAEGFLKGLETQKEQLKKEEAPQ